MVRTLAGNARLLVAITRVELSKKYAGSVLGASWLILQPALLLSVCVVSAFLAHWSLLDGAPRNSLRLFLDNQADRPFAYRILAPALVRAVDAALPAPAQGFLADRVAPRFHARYVEPLRTIFESLIPGISARADADWADARYRRSYVLMVMLMLASFTAAMLLIRRAACLLGASAFRADSVMLLYALITPTLFLKGVIFTTSPSSLARLHSFAASCRRAGVWPC